MDYPKYKSWDEEVADMKKEQEPINDEQPKEVPIMDKFLDNQDRMEAKEREELIDKVERETEKRNHDTMMAQHKIEQEQFQKQQQTIIDKAQKQNRTYRGIQGIINPHSTAQQKRDIEEARARAEAERYNSQFE